MKYMKGNNCFFNNITIPFKIPLKNFQTQLKERTQIPVGGKVLNSFFLNIKRSIESTILLKQFKYFMECLQMIKLISRMQTGRIKQSRCIASIQTYSLMNQAVWFFFFNINRKVKIVPFKFQFFYKYPQILKIG